MPVKPQFMIKRDGKDFVLYAGLLDLAHEEGLSEITTTLIQIPNELNGMTAICSATVHVAKGTFTGLGDARPGNVTRMMEPHIIRMAETRAKARALRDATNIGVAALEELGADDDEPAPQSSGQRTNGSARPPTAAPLPHAPASHRGVEVSPAAARVAAPPPTDTVPHPADSPGSAQAIEWPAVEAPAPPAAPAAPVVTRTNSGPPATPKQLASIQRMSRALGKRLPDMATLTRSDASAMLLQFAEEMDRRRSSNA